MQLRPFSLGVFVALFVVAIGVYLRIAPTLPVSPVAETEFDCPHSPDSISLAGDQVSIPEYNDCQQFIDQKGTTYLEKVGIYARAGLAGLPAPVTLDCDGVDRRDPLCSGRSGPLRTAVAVAVVHSWQAAPYDPLGIAPGYNCLYLESPANLGGSLTARMVPVGDEGECQPPVRRGADLVGTPLQVIDSAMAGVPGAARWAWSPTSNTQYVVMACPNGWCAVGSPGFQPDEYWEEEDPDGDNVLGGPRFRRRPGNDIQRLAVVSGGTLSPGRGWGIAVPDKGASATLEEFYGRWIRTTSLAYTDDTPKYEEGLNLRKGMPSSRMTTVELCANGARTETGPDACPMPWHIRIWLRTCDKDENGLRWVARINSHSGGLVYRCITRRDHGRGVVVPATVRWRWLATDEVIWTPCGSACCMVETGFD